jgi:hypothetical protein
MDRQGVSEETGWLSCKDMGCDQGGFTYLLFYSFKRRGAVGDRRATDVENNPNFRLSF